MSESKKEYITRRTLELYDMLPDDEEGRKARLDIRDEVIELNYSFFGYVASHTFINNSSVSYEDKLQSALTHFCECWWWFKWGKKYRTDLSFATFFKLRIGEMIERELNEVKYSTRRDLCMRVGNQLGKHWAQVKYDDLSDPRLNLPVDTMNSLKAIFGSLYVADISDHEMYLESSEKILDPFEHMTDKYDSIEDLLITEMVNEEKDLSDDDLMNMSEMYGISYKLLKQTLPIAKSKLYKKLQDEIALRQAFDT